MKHSDRKFQQALQKSKGNRLLALVLCISLTLSSFTGISFAGPKKAEAEAQGHTLSNPRIVADNSMQAKQKVTWDCIWFGSYPQAEVVPADREYTALDQKLLQDGDLIKDDALYRTLQAATGWDEKGDIVIGGDKYRRIKKEDATDATEDATEYVTHMLLGGYRWENGADYHYFKYQPIKWRVLSVNGSEAFLLADKVLDDKQYHTVSENVTWEGSTIRSWLNGYGASANLQKQDYSSSNFVNTAFDTSARAAIRDTRVENKDNLYYGTEGGEDTVDKVFLLSESEVCTDAAKGYGFVSGYNVYDEARGAESSVYAKALGIWMWIDVVGFDSYRNCCWWLRSPGYGSDYATRVTSDGWAGRYCNYYIRKDNGVRPALNLNLAASSDAGSPALWSYAGTVCSDEAVDGSEEAKKKPAKNLTKGTMVSDSKTKAVYKVTGTGKNKAVEYARSTKKNVFRITIPEKVKLRGQDYKVTSIAKNAFKNDKKLGYVIIGKNVKKIGEKAFYGCKKLRYIYVKSKILEAENIGKQAFGNGYKSPRVKSAKSVWRRYARAFPLRGLSKRAVYIL